MVRKAESSAYRIVKFYYHIKKTQKPELRVSGLFSSEAAHLLPWQLSDTPKKPTGFAGCSIYAAY